MVHPLPGVLCSNKSDKDLYKYSAVDWSTDYTVKQKKKKKKSF